MDVGNNSLSGLRAGVGRRLGARKLLAQQSKLPAAESGHGSRDGVRKLLTEHKPRLTERYGVTDLALFGSMARGAPSRLTATSHVLVAFDGPATSARYFGVMFYLEDLLGRPVDLVTVKALREELRPRRLLRELTRGNENMAPPCESCCMTRGRTVASMIVP